MILPRHGGGTPVSVQTSAFTFHTLFSLNATSANLLSTAPFLRPMTSGMVLNFLKSSSMSTGLDNVLPSMELRKDGKSAVGSVNIGAFLGAERTPGVLVAVGTNVADEVEEVKGVLLSDSSA